MLLVIDNYDSFVYNLVHYMQELGADVRVVRNDAFTADEALSLGAQGVLLSPGPCDPDKAGICLELLAKAPTDLPILGVCLGHQAIGQAFGGRVVPAKSIMHGKTSAIAHEGRGMFAGLPSPFTATRYHSLAIDPGAWPDEIEAVAHTDDGEVMGLAHRSRPIHGVQFHPESIASEHGHELLANFLRLCGYQAAAA